MLTQRFYFYNQNKYQNKSCFLMVLASHKCLINFFFQLMSCDTSQGAFPFFPFSLRRPPSAPEDAEVWGM